MTTLASAARGRFASTARAHPAFTFAVSAALTGVIVLPWLGSVGLWDPWETHYSEVGREMLARGDWVHPFWQDSYFFSKPALTLWMTAVGALLAGVNAVSGALPALTEWWIRLPFALTAMLSVGVLAHHVAALTTKRAGLLTAVVLATCPVWLFVSRQAMSDLPFVGFATIASGSFLRLVLDPTTSRRWVYAAWAAAALATLAKGALGVGLPLVTAALVVAVEAGSWAQAWATVRRLTPLDALLLFGVLALPWYVAMLRFEGVDNEGKTFFQRFVLHDHLARLTAGVHTDTPGGSFTYFIEQLGYGAFPWVGLLPVALGRLGQGDGSLRWRLARAMAVWAGLGFTLFTLSATRLHHYGLPVVPALAVLAALALERAVEEPLEVPLAALGAALVLVIGRDLAQAPRRWVELFTYNHERPYPDALDALPIAAGAPAWLTAHTAPWVVVAVVVGALAVLATKATLASRRQAVGALLAVGLGSGAWLSWSHWVRYGHEWTQRDLFARYEQLKRPDEPIAAFFMDWKGETFYSRNTVVQLGPANWQQQLPLFLGRAGRKWLLVEHARQNWLLQAIGAGHPVKAVDPGLNNKFVLLLVDG